jgi:clan AA aspartic protease (TIGR02281 family)
MYRDGILMNFVRVTTALSLVCIFQNADAQGITVYKCPSSDPLKQSEFTDIAKPGCKKIELTGADNSTSSAVSIARGRDGHFRVWGLVQNVRVRFLIDTGASFVAVPDQVAIGAELPAGTMVVMATAGGDRRARKIENVMVSVASLPPVKVTVVSGLIAEKPDTALLGMSFLQNYDIRTTGDLMTLTYRK